MFSRRQKTVNFLEGLAERDRRNVGKKTWRRSLIVGAAVLALLAAAAFMGAAGNRAYAAALSGKANLEGAIPLVYAMDFAGAESLARAAADDFAVGRREARRLSLLLPMPWVGERLTVANSLLAAGEHSAVAVAELASAAHLVLEQLDIPVWRSWDGLLPESGLAALGQAERRQVLSALAASAPALRAGRERAEEAILAFDRLPDNEMIRPYRDRLNEARDGFRALLPAIDAFLPAAELLPKALGYPEPQRYLFFFQNDTEMRPTGGFLGLVGQMTVRDGDLESIEVEDTYAYDAPSETVARPPAPEPIQKYARVMQWYLRDANWSPDFTVSAPLMEQFFLEEAEVRNGVRPAPFDGVIAVTPRLAEDILRLTGPITVSGETFDADSLVDHLEFQVEMAFVDKGIDRDDRKGIVGELMREMISRAMEFDAAQILRAVQAVGNRLEGGHILLYARDERLQAAILERDWGGRLRDFEVDYLSVIDANLAALKTDPAVGREISYRIRPDGAGGHFGYLSVTYANRGQFDWKTTRYRTYTRLYLPAGSRLLGVSGALENDRLNDPAGRPGRADVGEDLGRQWFGAFISIEPGQSRTLEFSFALAPSVSAAIAAGEYALTFERQSGTPGYGLTLDLDFGKNLTAAEPAEAPTEYGDGRYRLETDLTKDREFRVLLR